MVLEEKRVEFEAERERLLDRMEELAAKQVEYEDSPEKAEQLLVQGNELNNQREILGTLAEEWGVDGVTLRGLSEGDTNRVEKTVEDHPAVRERTAWVALGTADAPYLEHDPESFEQPDYEDTVASVADLPLAYVRWAEGKVSELSHLGAEEGNEYLRLVEEKTNDQPNQNG